MKKENGNMLKQKNKKSTQSETEIEQIKAEGRGLKEQEEAWIRNARETLGWIDWN